MIYRAVRLPKTKEVAIAAALALAASCEARIVIATTFAIWIDRP
jgi:hypothetical protein